MTMIELFTRPASGNDLVRPQLCKQVEEAVVARLIVEEAEPAALAHVGDDFDRPAKVCVGMPGRGELREIRLGELIAAGDAGPDQTFARELRLQGLLLRRERRRLEAEPAGDARP